VPLSESRNLLDKATLDRISQYAYITGKPISKALNEAVNEWMDSTGDLIILEIQERRRKRAKGRHKKKDSSTCISSSPKFQPKVQSAVSKQAMA
jgi:hypothetical protein